MAKTELTVSSFDKTKYNPIFEGAMAFLLTLERHGHTGWHSKSGTCNFSGVYLLSHVLGGRLVTIIAVKCCHVEHFLD